MANLNTSKKKPVGRTIKKKVSSKRLDSVFLAEKELELKKNKLLRAKARYRKLAGEFIDQWVKVRKLKGFIKPK
jgi:hypothetical protein